MVSHASWEVTWNASSARATKVRWQTAGGTEPLAKPVDLAIAENGDIFVLDAGAARIVRVGPSGKVIAEFGRSGDGPGELGGGLARLFLGPGGTVYVPNPSARSLEQFSGAGDYRGALAMPFGSGPPIGYAVFDSDRVFRAASTLRRDVQGHGVIDPVVHITKLGSDSVEVVAQLSGGRAPQTGLYAAAPLWAVGRTGIVIASADHFELQFFDSTFSRVAVWSSAQSLTPIEPADRAVLANQAFRQLQPLQRQQTVAALSQRVGFAEKYPTWSAVVIADNGDVWLNPPATADDIRAGDATEFSFDRTGSRRWLVYSDEGDRLGEVQVPTDFLLKQVHGNSLFGLGTDAGGNPVVQALVIVPRF